jgi:hypothetical protein
MEHGDAAQDAQRANNVMREHWNKAVSKEFNMPLYYTSVAVLLIRWADRSDGSLEYGKDVRLITTYATSFRHFADETPRLQSLKTYSVTNLDSQREPWYWTAKREKELEPNY